MHGTAQNRKHFTLVEGYSRNDESKKRQNAKTPAKETNGRKRTKRD